jgi:hypothetical protein
MRRPAYSFAWRALRRLPRVEWTAEPSAEEGLAIPAGWPRPFAIYRDRGETTLAMTDRALYVLDGSWREVAYADIARTVGPPSKLDAASLRLILRDGSAVNVTVTGGDGVERDLFSVMTFVGNARRWFAREPEDRR